jgi:hypothetical protein
MIKIDFKEKKITISEKEEVKLTISGSDLKKVFFDVCFYLLDYSK